MKPSFKTNIRTVFTKLDKLTRTFHVYSANLELELEMELHYCAEESADDY
jgi:hypothetical protein